MATIKEPNDAANPPAMSVNGNIHGPRYDGRSAAPKILSSTKKSRVRTEEIYAPIAMNPGCEQENSPWYPLMTLMLMVNIIEIIVNLTTRAL